jgi:hypothetical protein
MQRAAGTNANTNRDEDADTDVDANLAGPGFGQVRAPGQSGGLTPGLA